MAEGRRVFGSVRLRATLGALGVVAALLVAAAVALVLLQRVTLEEAAEDTAEAQAGQLAGQITASGPPDTLAGRDDEVEDDELEDVVAQVVRGTEVVVSSQAGVRLPLREGSHDLAGSEHRYTVATSPATWQGDTYAAVVAVSLEDAEESTEALVGPMAVGTPLVLLLVTVVIWLVVGRSLAPVERMRREVATISDERLDRRVPLPGSRDEVQRLGVTLNAMLARLESARERQRRFVSDASHELRSPIATLRQSGEVAHRHPDAFDSGELADTVVAESLRLQRLVDQLLALTRADEGVLAAERRDVDVDDLLLAEATRLRTSRPDLRVDTSAVAAARVVGNPAALDQVFRNLADNAARHARGVVCFASVAEDGRVRASVVDDGAGIPADQRTRVFERFVRLDEARSRDAGGSGLGLAIVSEIVAAHGGSVRVVEAPEGGAEFVVDLPAG